MAEPEVWGGLALSGRIILIMIMATSREPGRVKDNVGEVNSEFVGLNNNQITKISHTTCA